MARKRLEELLNKLEDIDIGSKVITSSNRDETSFSIY